MIREMALLIAFSGVSIPHRIFLNRRNYVATVLLGDLVSIPHRIFLNLLLDGRLRIWRKDGFHPS